MKVQHKISVSTEANHKKNINVTLWIEPFNKLLCSTIMKWFFFHPSYLLYTIVYFFIFFVFVLVYSSLLFSTNSYPMTEKNAQK